MTVTCDVSIARDRNISKHETLNKCWINVGPASWTVALARRGRLSDYVTWCSTSLTVFSCLNNIRMRFLKYWFVRLTERHCKSIPNI